MEIIRRIIFYIFVTVYVILCPLLILYSLGYIVYPLNEKLVHTGVVHLSTWPSDAQVFIEKSRYTEKTPVTIRDLLPGEYVIRAELKDHHPWSHKVLVEDGKAVAFEKILLLPYSWSTKAISKESFNDLTPLTGTGYLLLSKDEQLKDYYVYDWKKDSSRPFLVADQGLSDLRVSALFSEEDSQALVILGGPVWDRKYFYTQVVPQGMELKDISKLITGRPLQMDWDPASRDSIFALYEGYVDRLDTVSAALYPKYIEDIHGWGVSRNQIFIIDRDSHVLSSSAGKKDLKIAFDNPELSDILAREKDFYDIKPMTSDSIVFLGNHSAVILNHERPHVINEQIIGVRYDSESNRILLWSRKSIGIFDLSGEGKTRLTSENLAQVRWVFDQGKDIRQCFWAYEGSHVVFRDGNKIFLLEPEPQGPAHADLVTSSKEGSSVTYVEAKGVLFYLGENDGKLYALDIISKKGAVRPPFLEEHEPKKDSQ